MQPGNYTARAAALGCSWKWAMHGRFVYVLASTENWSRAFSSPGSCALHTAAAAHSAWMCPRAPASQAVQRASWGMGPLVRNSMATLGMRRAAPQRSAALASCPSRAVALPGFSACTQCGRLSGLYPSALPGQDPAGPHCLQHCALSVHSAGGLCSTCRAALQWPGA